MRGQKFVDGHAGVLKRLEERHAGSDELKGIGEHKFDVHRRRLLAKDVKLRRGAIGSQYVSLDKDGGKSTHLEDDEVLVELLLRGPFVETHAASVKEGTDESHPEEVVR